MAGGFKFRMQLPRAFKTMKQQMWEYASGKTALYVGVCILYT